MENSKTEAGADADPSSDAAMERPPMTLGEEIDRLGEHSPLVADLLRKVNKWIS